ncbi:MAG: DUF3341 domain-containing protein [Planctomycetota bacterium]
MTGSLHVGLFEDDRDVLDAVRECRERGIPIVDVVSPYPIHGLDPLLGIRPSRLPWVTLGAGAVGLALGTWGQYWTSAVSWPLNIGGKPFDSLPAFVPVMFEMTVLFAGLATAAALCLRSKIWPGRRIPAGLERTSDDQFALILAQEDAAFREQDFTELLQRHGAVETRHETEDQS